MDARRSRIPSARECYLCLWNELSPMCPEYPHGSEVPLRERTSGTGLEITLEFQGIALTRKLHCDDN
jgi:hypothetical protein